MPRNKESLSFLYNIKKYSIVITTQANLWDWYGCKKLENISWRYLINFGQSRVENPIASLLQGQGSMKRACGLFACKGQNKTIPQALSEREKVSSEKFGIEWEIEKWVKNGTDSREGIIRMVKIKNVQCK